MSQFRWDDEKNKKLKKERGVSFEEIIFCIENEGLLQVVPNPSENHRNQEIYVLEFKNYVYLVPYVRVGKEIFLKTIIPSRKAKKKYLKRSQNEIG